MTITAPAPRSRSAERGSTQGAAIEISVVIALGPTSDPMVPHVVATVAGLDERGTVEVVLVDDVASPETRTAIADLGPRCRVLHAYPQIGSANATIAGVKIARGSILILAGGAHPLNDDVITEMAAPFASDPGLAALTDPSTHSVALRKTAITSIGGIRSLRTEPNDRDPLPSDTRAALLAHGWRTGTRPIDPTSAPAVPPMPWVTEGGEAFDPTTRFVWNPPTIPRAPRPGINVIGLLEAACGVGDAARRYVDAIASTTFACSTLSYHGHGSPEHPFTHRGDGSLAYDTSIIALNADLIPGFAAIAGREVWNRRYTIGLWFWELERLSPSIESGFDAVHELWASTPFLRDAFAAGTDKPVVTIPLPIDRHDGPPRRGRRELGLPAGFLFATIFDFSSLAERKNALGVVRAFCDAFPPGSGPSLVLKTLNAGRDRAGWLALRAATGGRRDVVIVDGYLDDDVVSELIGNADCYVSLHRAEGFGLTPAEAMAWGRPVIATGYSGNLAFMTPENSYLIGYDLVPVPDRFASVYRPGSVWAEPHHAEAVAAMRAVVARPADAAARGLRGQREIRRTHSVAAAASAITRRMTEIGQLRAWEASPATVASGGTDMEPIHSVTVPRAVCIVDRSYLDRADLDRADRRTPSIVDALLSEGVAVHVIAASPDGRAIRHLRDRITLHLLVTGPSSTWMRTVDSYFPIVDAQVEFDAVFIVPEGNGDGVTLDVGPHTAVVLIDPTDPSSGDTDALLDAVTAAGAVPRIADAFSAPSHPSPMLGIVVLAHNALSATKRSVRSVLHHTTLPFRLAVVDNGSLDGTAEWLGAIDDPRVTVVSAPENLGVARGRNLGIDALEDSVDLVAFLDNDVEVLASWHAPFIAALDRDLACGIVGEEGAVVAWTDDGCLFESLPHRDPASCDTVAGFAMVVRSETVRTVGRFDESLGLFWHEELDYAMRAARLGVGVTRTAAGTVLHFPAPSSHTVPCLRSPDGSPGPLAERNLRTLAARHARQRPSPTSPFLIVADATEVANERAILASYGATFTASDAVALIVVGIDGDPAATAAAVEAQAITARFDLDDGPRIIVMTPSSSDVAALERLADEVHVVIGRGPADAVFHHLGRTAPVARDALRLAAAATWSVRPAMYAEAAR